MKKLILTCLLASAALMAQQPQPILPDCIININFIGAGTTNNFDNTRIGCDSWTMVYTSTGFTGLTLTFQSAPTGPVVPGTFVTFAGTVVSGSNPLTSTTQGAATFTNLGASPVATPWLHVTLSGLTGTGQVTGVVYGYRTGYSSGNGGGGGTPCPGTTGKPCVVDGPTAAGSAPTTPPIYVAGIDGTNLRGLKTDTAGDTVIVGPDAAGAAPTKNPAQVAGFDGTNIRPIKTDTSGDSAVFQIGLGTFSTGQQAVTGTAANLGTNTAKAVCVKALIGNTINVYVGATGVTTGTGFELTPGQGVCEPVSNTNLIFVIASTTGASVAWALVN